MASRYGLEIRGANAADAPGLEELLASGGLRVAPGLVERLEAVKRSGAVLLASDWGPPSGVAAVSWRPALLTPAPAASLDLLLVAPGDRRRGIGRLLLKAASQAARTAGCDRLELRVSAGEDLRGFAADSGFSGGGEVLVRPLRKGR